jgi:hypothetical protein
MSAVSKPVYIGPDFLRDLHADYRAHGAAAIATLRREEPRNYFKLLHSLLHCSVPAPVSPSGGPELGKSARE